ncbi:MAG: hypothetical protein JWM21_2587 [Acidobacteria bacterium]|nr:hypothetical protein [Acidobacteriota bacterium]
MRLIKCCCLILLVIACSRAFCAAQSSKRLFEIPVFTGTVLFNENPNLKRLQPPFATRWLVYRTADGGRLDKEKVIAFYRSILENKGWRDDIFKRRGDEAYLGMQVHVFENLTDGTRIQLSGKFYLWVAPQDGIYSILLDEWRISAFDQQTLNNVNRIVGALESLAAKRGYSVQKVYEDGNWDKDYENEYLIDRIPFALIARSSTGPHPASNQYIELVVLTYRDSAGAEDEARHLRPALATDGKPLMDLSTVFNQVVVKRKTLILIRDSSAKQKEAVTGIAADLAKL